MYAKVEVAFCRALDGVEDVGVGHVVEADWA